MSSKSMKSRQLLANWVICLLLIVDPVAVSTQDSTEGCFQVSFDTRASRCRISVKQCQHSLVFSSCAKTMCLRGQEAQNCSLEQSFELSEDSCRRECCMGTDLEPSLCLKEEVAFVQYRSKLDKLLLSAIGGAIVMVLLISCAFLKAQAQQSQSSENSESKEQIWESSYIKPTNCDACNGREPQVLLSCRHFLHQKCLMESSELDCPVCGSLTDSEVLFICRKCSTKSIRVNLTGRPSTVAVAKFYLTETSCGCSVDDIPFSEINLTEASEPSQE